MNARQMIARFANGGDVSTGLKYATGEGGIGAAKYYENIRNFVNTKGADLNAAEVRAEMDKWGVSDKDVRDALAGTQYSGAAVHALLNPDIGAADAPGRGVGGLEGMSANIRDYIQDQVAAKMTREQLGNVLTQQMGAYNPETGVGGFNEQDLIRATGKTASQLLNDLYGVNQKPPPTILPPTEPLPDLTEEFVEPTAPLPQAPPSALTPGQEGLDPGTAIVGAIPKEERVTIPQLDTEFRASAPRTAIYDRFGRITGYNYSPAAKLTPATGTNVFNFVPPGITSRPRSLLNIGDVPGVTIDPVTGQMNLPLSASQRFARDRAELDNQFRQLYARAAEADTSLPTQAPGTAAAAFRNFAMSDPTMSAQLRMRDIEQTPTVNPTAAMTAARSEFGAAPYAAALTAAFDPFLARNKAALLASKDMQRSYFERYPDLVAEYEKNWSKTMSPEEYAAYHYRTLGQKEGRTPPNLMGSPYTQQFFSKGGEASTEDFIKKQSGGDVSRETASPNTAEVPKLDTEGRLIDEREEIRSESQRMLNRLQSQPSKLPPGIRRTVAATREQGKESMLPAAAPARDLLSGILGASPTAPGSEAYRTGQAIANMPPVQAAAAIPAKIAASAGDAATALAAMGPAVGAVMKPKGGNWLAPSVERGLNYLIPRTGAGNRTAKETLEEMNRTYPAEELARMPETKASVDRAYRWLEPNVAVQNWIEKKLIKYVKNEMATPEDPVRALAERGILHVDPEQLSSYPGAGNPTNQAVARRALSYPEEGLARSEAAKKWETASDYMIQTDRALNLLNPKEYGQGFVDQTLAANPWLTKVDPYERIYGVDTLNYRPDYSELGFDHLIDELKNSLNPNSGLPRALQLTPKQLDKVSVPQAVELVDKINKWRAEQKVAADLKRSQNAATVEYKAYDTVPGTAEPNQRGLRWVELRAPTEGLALPKGYSIQTSHGTPYLQDEKGQVVQYLDDANGVDAAAKKVVGRMSLEDALKYEGETMGHCVGGYCPDVEKGRSRIYSLRDAKGEPHVTIEVQPYPYAPKWEVVKGYLPQAEEMMRARGITNASEEEISELATQLAKENMPSSIQQIKGKANRAPKDEYLPFVQDFVRSGQWSAVGDIRNTGLIEIDPSSDLARNIRAAGGEPPKFVTQQELTEWLNWWRLRQYGDPTNGFKKGGEVTIDDFINQSLTDGERKQNIKLDSVQSLQDFLQSLPKGPPSPQPVEPDNVLPDVALKRKGAKELESYINALNPRAQVFDVPEGYQSSYRSSPFGLKGSGLVGSVPIREPDRINVLNTLTPGQRERVLLHEAEHSMSLRGGDIQGELDSKGRPIIMDNAFRAVALLKGNELPVREFVKNVALNKDKIDAFFGEPSFGSEFKKQSYEELRKRGRELALFEEQLASLSALEQATGKFLTQDKEMRKLLFPNTEMMSIFDALTGPRQTRMDARDLPPHTPMNPMSYETGNAISRFIAEKTRKPLLRELPEAKMRVK